MLSDAALSEMFSERINFSPFRKRRIAQLCAPGAGAKETIARPAVSDGSANATEPASQPPKRLYTLRLTLLGPSLNVCSRTRLAACEPLPKPTAGYFESACHLKLRSAQHQLRQRDKRQLLLQKQLTSFTTGTDTYCVNFRIGHGNFGRVYHCLGSANRARAIKATRNLTSFSREVKMHAVLQSGHTEKSYASTFVLWLSDSVKLERDSADVGCLVLELATGGSLEELVGNLSKCDRRLTQQEAKFYLAEMGCALQYLHERGCVHLDFKADNVLLSAEGHARLADFGNSLRLDAGGDADCSLEAGLGTYHLPPEVMATGSKRVAPSTDWFSYGCFAYWLLHLLYPIVPAAHTRTAEDFAAYMRAGGYRRLCRAQFAAQSDAAYRSLVLQLLLPAPSASRLGAGDGFGDVVRTGFFGRAEAADPDAFCRRVRRLDLEPPFVPLLLELVGGGVCAV